MPQKAFSSGANAVPMGKLHPVLAAKRQDSTQDGGQRPPLPSSGYKSPAPFLPVPPPPSDTQERPPLPIQAYPDGNKRIGKTPGKYLIIFQRSRLSIIDIVGVYPS